jgi:hypothetical protein
MYLYPGKVVLGDQEEMVILKTLLAQLHYQAQPLEE